MTRDPRSLDAAGRAPPVSGIRNLGARAVGEARRLLVLFVYLWVLFGLFVLNQRIILHQEGIDFAAHGFAIFNAFILAKVMLGLEHLNIGRWLDRRPLIYPILHDSLLFTVLFIVFHVVEGIVLGMVKGKSLAESIPSTGGGGIAGIICVAIILFFALIPFFAFRNFSRALGTGRMKQLLFGSAPEVQLGS